MIGLGAADRGDDAAGLEVARRVKRAPSVERNAGSLGVLDLWEDADEVIVVDAMRSGEAPGTVRRFDGHLDEMPTGTFVTTHALGPAEAVELARVLGRLPSKLTVYGIESARTDLGAELSPEVAVAVRRVAAEIDNA